jgi:diguanylate cyclase (GGDEF)-like protein
MNHLELALSAALGVAVAVIVFLLAFGARRSSRRADARVAEVVRTLEARMNDLAQELNAALERAEADARRSRFLAEISGSIDLDDVLARTLDGALSLAQVDAALLRVDGGEGEPVTASVGFEGDDPDPQALGGPPDRHPMRAVELTYHHAGGEYAAHAVTAGLVLPLSEQNGAVGWLGAYTREAGARFAQEDVDRLHELAGRAAPAIENARRFREARQLADLDALTGLHNRRFFHETLAREVARAHRYDRALALAVLDLDDFKAVNDRIGHLAGDAVLAEAAERMRDVVRTADIACRVGGDEFAVILPEAGLEQATQLVARIQGTVSGRPVGQAGRLKLSAGVAELRSEDDASSLFERADEALYRAKQQGKGQAASA